MDAYKALLKKAGVSEKRIDAIVKITDIDGIDLTKDGKIKDEEAQSAKIKEDYAEFITRTEERGANTARPPMNGGRGEPLTKEAIMGIKDRAERRRVIAENINLFKKIILF